MFCTFKLVLSEWFWESYSCRLLYVVWLCFYTPQMLFIIIIIKEQFAIKTILTWLGVCRMTIGMAIWILSGKPSFVLIYKTIFPCADCTFTARLVWSVQSLVYVTDNYGIVDQFVTDFSLHKGTQMDSATYPVSCSFPGGDVPKVCGWTLASFYRRC